MIQQQLKSRIFVFKKIFNLYVMSVVGDAILKHDVGDIHSKLIMRPTEITIELIVDFTTDTFTIDLNDPFNVARGLINFVPGTTNMLQTKEANGSQVVQFYAWLSEICEFGKEELQNEQLKAAPFNPYENKEAIKMAINFANYALNEEQDENGVDRTYFDRFVSNLNKTKDAKLKPVSKRPKMYLGDEDEFEK